MQYFLCQFGLYKTVIYTTMWLQTKFGLHKIINNKIVDRLLKQNKILHLKIGKCRNNMPKC